MTKIKGILLLGDCSSMTLLLENGVRLDADSKVHDIELMLALWHSRYTISQLA